jgi:hypothetical protein
VTNDDLIGLAVTAFLWLKGKKASASEAKPAAADDGQKLVARANQAAAKAWVTLFKGQDVPPLLAEALARWAGIESSGNPLIPSKIGERGLLQIGAKSFADAKKDGILTDADWAALSSPATTPAEHARLSYKIANWLWTRARKYVKNPPEDYISGVWYSKLYHQRPVNVRDGGMHGPAPLMALELADRWKTDPKKMHRLRAANVVAWGTPEPPPRAVTP